MANLSFVLLRAFCSPHLMVDTMLLEVARDQRVKPKPAIENKGGNGARINHDWY